MGAERWLEFAEGEKEKVLSYLDGVTWVGQEGRWGWWLEWNDDDYGDGYGGPRLEVGYQMGVDSSEGAAFVCRELAKRFKVTRIGADSTGWYDDESWNDRGERSPHSRYGSYSSYAEWVKVYKAEWCPTYLWGRGKMDADELEEHLREMREIEAFVTAWFEALDARRNPPQASVVL